MGGRGVSGAGSDGSLRLVWRLFSPSFRQVSCALTRQQRAFVLTVEDGDQVLTSCVGSELETLHAKAAEWRALLEARGYIPVGAARASDPRPAERRGEARTALIGLVECAAVLELQHPAIARRIRDRATEGLVAVGLRDHALMAEAIAACRNLVAEVSAADSEAALLASSMALLDRAESTLPDAPNRLQ